MPDGTPTVNIHYILTPCEPRALQKPLRKPGQMYKNLLASRFVTFTLLLREGFTGTVTGTGERSRIAVAVVWRYSQAQDSQNLGH